MKTPEGVRRLSIVFGIGLALTWSIFILVNILAAGGVNPGETYTVAWVWFIGAGVLYFAGVGSVRGSVAVWNWVGEGFKNPQPPARAPLSTTAPPAADGRALENLGGLKCVRCSRVYQSRYYFKDEGEGMDGLICTECAVGTP